MGKKWEEIPYEKIKMGDTIRHTVSFGKNKTMINIGKVMKQDHDDSSNRLTSGQWIFPDAVYVDEDKAEEVIVERKRPKPKPFVYPKPIGSVIKGTAAAGMKLPATFIKVDDNKYYSPKSQAFYTEYEIGLFYIDLERVENEA